MHPQASSTPGPWLRFTSLFLPAHVRADTEQHRNGRIAVGILVVAAAFALQWVPVYPAVMAPEVGWRLSYWLLGCAALACGLLYVCRWSHQLAVHLLLAYVLVMFSVAERMTGAAHSLFVMWSLALPLSAMLVGGQRAAWAWLTLVVASYAVLFVQTRAGVEFPNFLAPETRAPLAAFSVSSLVLFVFALGALSEGAQTTAVQSLRAAHAQLSWARDAAEAANRAKAEFLANASHEIRTPMTAILGFADVLLAESDARSAPDADRDALATLRRNAARLLDVINDILDLAKLEAGRLEFDPVPFSPSELLRDTLAAFAPEARERGIELVLESCAGLPERVYGDRPRIAQVLLHLVENAIKFTERGRVALRADRTANGCLRIEVADTGIGIRPDQLSALFEPFSQGDGSSSRTRGGAGLGLSLCKRLVSLMGGEIRAASRPGEGTTFSVELDLPEVADGAMPERLPASAAKAPRDAAQRALQEPSVATARPFWSRLEAAFLPPGVDGDPERLARARIALTCALAPMPLIPAFAVVFATSLSREVALYLIACQIPFAMLCLAIPFALRSGRSAALAAHAHLGGYLACCGLLASVTGAAASPHLTWVALLPPFALAFVGRRGAVAWTAAAALLPLAFLGGAWAGIPLPDRARPDAWMIAWLVTVAAQAALAALLGLVYERPRQESVRGLEQANAALAELRDAAERASRARSEFLANVSHEIRTPMTAVLGFAELLASEGAGGESPERLEALDTIRRNGAHLLALLEDLLDLSQIEAGRMVIQRVPFAPAALASEVAALLRERAESKGLALRVRVAPSVPPRVLGDPTRTRQILVNLLGNAIKFTERGRVELALDVDPREPAALRLEVTDTGVGIEPEKLGALFQRFVQADRGVSERFGGSGLGLAICRRLADLLGGSIDATSQRGVGSCFRVTLPAEPAPEPARARVPARSARAARGALRGRVLLAEDGPDNQNLIARVLSGAGLEVERVGDGAQALEAVVAAEAEGRPFGAILMDLEMPVLDGTAATRELRARGVTTPIIALTAHAESEHRRACLAAGFDDFAAKPIDRRGLLDALARWLDAEKRQSASAPE